MNIKPSSESAVSAFWPLLALGMVAGSIATLVVSRRKTVIARELTVAISDWENEGGSVAMTAAERDRLNQADGAVLPTSS